MNSGYWTLVAHFYASTETFTLRVCICVCVCVCVGVCRLWSLHSRLSGGAHSEYRVLAPPGCTVRLPTHPLPTWLPIPLPSSFCCHLSSHSLPHTHWCTLTHTCRWKRWHFQEHLRLCAPNPPPYMRTHNCARPHICMSVYTQISWTRAFAYPYAYMQHMHAHMHTQRQTTLHMHRHRLTPTAARAYVCYLSITLSICFCLHV